MSAMQKLSASDLPLDALQIGRASKKPGPVGVEVADASRGLLGRTNRMADPEEK